MRYALYYTQKAVIEDENSFLKEYEYYFKNFDPAYIIRESQWVFKKD